MENNDNDWGPPGPPPKPKILSDILKEPKTRKWRPANGSEGDWFMSKFCEKCSKDEMGMDTDEELYCEILGRTMAFDVDDPEYPEEWISYDNPESPSGESVKCTAFEPREEEG